MVMILEKGRKEHEASIWCSKAKRLVIIREALKSDTGLEFSLYHCCPPCDIGPNLSNIRFLIYKIRSILISPFHPWDSPCLQSVVLGQHRQSPGPICPGGSGPQNRKEIKTQEGKLRQKRGFYGSVQNDWGREKNTIKDVYQDLSSATYII